MSPRFKKFNIYISRFKIQSSNFSKISNYVRRDSNFLSYVDIQSDLNHFEAHRYLRRACISHSIIDFPN